MPFIAQCPSPPCRKFNLIEDVLRGQTVKCLVCKTTFRADNAVCICPKCATKNSVPASRAGQQVQCYSCGTVFP